MNSEIGNAGFMAKRPYYERAPFQLTSMLRNNENWGVVEIEARQEYLADIAVKAWPNRG